MGRLALAKYGIKAKRRSSGEEIIGFIRLSNASGEDIIIFLAFSIKIDGGTCKMSKIMIIIAS